MDMLGKFNECLPHQSAEGDVLRIDVVFLYYQNLSSDQELSPLWATSRVFLFIHLVCSS